MREVAPIAMIDVHCAGELFRSAYAEAILHVCKRHVKTPLACMAGVASSNLRERVEAIMNYRKPSRLSLGHKLVLFAAVAAAALGPLLRG